MTTSASEEPMTTAPLLDMSAVPTGSAWEEAAAAGQGRWRDTPEARDTISPAPSASPSAKQTGLKQAVTGAASLSSAQGTPTAAVAEPAQFVRSEQAAPVVLAEAAVQQPQVAERSPAASLRQSTSPAAQLAPALMQLRRAADGTQQLTLRLDPPELGHVQIRIERTPDAPARVEITVEKADTLTLLLRDQPQLQRALDQAGVSAEGRNVTFHVAPPAPSLASGDLTGGGSHEAPPHDSRPGHRQVAIEDASEADSTPIALTAWVRGGLDITA